MPIPKDVVKKDHVLEALATIDKDGVPWERQSTKFDLLYKGKEYPPKYAISLAFGFATGKDLHLPLVPGVNSMLNTLRRTFVQSIAKNSIAPFLPTPLNFSTWFPVRYFHLPQ
jgi:hypothetical protein